MPENLFEIRRNAVPKAPMTVGSPLPLLAMQP